MYELLMLLRSSDISFWLSGNRILYSPYDFTERQDPSLPDRRQAGIRERPRVYIRGEKRPAARPFSFTCHGIRVHSCHSWLAGRQAWLKKAACGSGIVSSTASSNAPAKRPSPAPEFNFKLKGKNRLTPQKPFLLQSFFKFVDFHN